jgi:peroxiredoxin
MRSKFWVAAGLMLLAAAVIYENVTSSGKKPVATTSARKVAMVSPEKAKLRMIYFWGDCHCNENIAAELVAQERGYDVHTRIVRLKDPDRAELMRRYKVDKGPYTVFLNPKNGKVLMSMRWATYDDFQDAIHEMLQESGYGFADTGQPVARGVAKVGQPAPEINVIGEANIGFSLQQYHGRKVVLAFLCGCERCKPLVPKLNQIVRQQGQDRVTVLAITAFSKEGRDQFKADTKPDFAVCIDPDRKTIVHYASEACPRLWVIDEQGIIRYTNSSITTPAARLVADLHKQLGA